MHCFYSHVKVGENVYRERNGVDFEDLEPGMTFQHRPGRTVYQVENALHSLYTLNQAAIHYDACYAASTEFGKPLIVTTLTLSIIMAMTTKTFGRVVANLGMKEVRMPAPVFDGDTLYAESVVLEKRVSKSRPGNGVLTIQTRGHNQNNVTVCEYTRTLLLYLRGYEPYAASGY